MIMSGVYSNCVLFACLLVCVLGSELVRNKRQGPYTDDDYFGSCGKPTTPIPHGGIKLFPTGTLNDLPYDNSCYRCRSTGFCPFTCELKFYCEDGFEQNGVFHLECVQNATTRGYEWEGSIPACEEIKTTRLVIFVAAFPVMLMIGIIGAAIRSHQRGGGRTRTAPRTSLRPTTISISPSSRARGGRTYDIPRAPFRGPGYSRLDDSNVNVPRDETITSRYDTEAPAMETVSPDAPPSYTQALQMEGADPASTVITPKATVDTPAAVIATT